MLPQELDNKTLEEAKQQAKLNLEAACRARFPDLRDRLRETLDEKEAQGIRVLIDLYLRKEARLIEEVNSKNTVEDIADLLAKITSNVNSEY